MSYLEVCARHYPVFSVFLILMSPLGKRDVEASSVIPSILEAVQVRLQLPAAAARKRAMLLAQAMPLFAARRRSCASSQSAF